MSTVRDGPWINDSGAERALRESADLFRGVYEFTAIGVTVVGLDLRIRAVNKTLSEMLGYTEAEMIATTFPAITHPEDRAIGGQLHVQLVKGEIDVARFEKRYIHKDGHVVWAFVCASMVRDTAGGPAYIVSQIMDLSPRKNAEIALARSTAALRESEEKFRGAFESAGCGFSVTEFDGRIRSANRSMYEMLGYTEKEMLEHTLQELSHPDDLNRSAILRQQLQDGKIDHVRLEMRYLHKDGHVVWTDVAAALVRVAEAPAYYVVQMTDITRRKNAEDALVRYSAELERSNAELQSFAYVASHDLQQPLRTVASFTRLLAERYQGSVDARADRWIAHITNGVERMQQLINDLLLLAQIRSDGDAFSPTDVDALAARVWSTLDERYAIDAALTRGGLPTLSADSAQIELLMQNLFENAFKYRRSGVKLEVGCSAHRTEATEPTWEFAITDNGIGFDMINSARVFELFSRLHSADEYHGTGIGLTICRRIVERHGGRIWARSTPGEGSVFHFTLPERHD
jgi:PAS domain S-box-containing protein